MNMSEFIDLSVSIQAEDNNHTHRWTPEQVSILRRYYGFMTNDEIGQLIGCSANAVILYAQRILHMPGPSRDPDYISTRMIAENLGLDEHITPSWVDRGLLDGQYLPRADNKLHRRVRMDIFIVWLTDPQNWIWFDIHKVRNPVIKQLIEQASQAWGDEWWTTNQVAAYHGVHNKDVLRYIKHGKVAAIQAHNRSGRNTDHWANWYILRSEATRPDLKFKQLRKTIEKKNDHDI
jgi:hypothetical protein